MRDRVLDGETSGRTLSYWMDRYSITHQNKTNVLIHKACVPLIFFSTIALLGVIRFMTIVPGITVTGSWALIAYAFVFYFRISVRHSFIMGVVAVLSVTASELLYFQFGSDFMVACAIVFALAWVGQFIGHKFEGAKPAFFEDILFLLIGPLWVAESILNRKLKPIP